MMQFRVIRQAIIDLLDTSSGGRYRVIGRKVQSKSQDEVKNSDRLVQVAFTDGNFPKIGAMRGHKIHDLTIEINLSASAAATGDLTVLDNPMATQQQKAAAILAIREAGENADEKIDDLIEIVYQIMMDARNERLGLDRGEVASRWISDIKKDTLLERGDLIVRTANMRYTCRVSEAVLGDIGVVPDPLVIDAEIPVSDIPGAGVVIEN